MKLLWKFGNAAIRYKALYIIAILSTFMLTFLNLAAPKALAAMTGIVKDGVTRETLDSITFIALVLLGIYLARVVFTFLASYLAHKAAWNLVGDVRNQMYVKLQSLSMAFYHDKQTGDLMSRIIYDTASLELLYAHIIPDLLTSLVTVAGVMIILLSINWRLALFTCLPIPFILAMGVLFSKKIRPYFRKNQRVTGELSAMLQDNISGVLEIQAFAKEKKEAEKIGAKVGESVKAMLKALKLSGIFHPSVGFLSAAGSVIVVAAGGYYAYLGKVGVEDIVAFLLYLTLFYAPIAGLAQLIENAGQAFAGAERALLILDSENEIKESPGAVEMPRPKGAVAFENVSFGYNGDEKVLQNVSFEAKPGEMVAFCGPTGVGKTTMSKLISRTYDPDAGAF